MGMGGLWNGEIEEEIAREKKGKEDLEPLKKKKSATKKKEWMRERRERSKKDRIRPGKN